MVSLSPQQRPIRSCNICATPFLMRFRSSGSKNDYLPWVTSLLAMITLLLCTRTLIARRRRSSLMCWRLRSLGRQLQITSLWGAIVRYQTRVALFTQGQACRTKMNWAVSCKFPSWYVFAQVAVHLDLNCLPVCLLGWDCKQRFRRYWRRSRRQRLVCVYWTRYYGHGNQCYRSYIQWVHHFFCLPFTFLNIFPITELQGQSSSAVIGEMRDSLIDNWAWLNFHHYRCIL
jgi:hypothetical protein